MAAVEMKRGELILTYVEVKLSKNSYERRTANLTVTPRVLTWETMLQSQTHSWIYDIVPRGEL